MFWYQCFAKPKKKIVFKSFFFPSFEKSQKKLFFLIFLVMTKYLNNPLRTALERSNENCSQTVIIMLQLNAH